MASWTIHDGGILGKNRLGFGNFTNSTGGFGSNSALIPKGNDFTPPRQTVDAGGGFGSNSVILPKGDDFTESQSPFGSYPIRQSPPFCTNPTDATPFSSPFGTNSALRNDTNQQTANTVTQPLFGTDPIPIGQSPFSTNPNATPTTPFSSQSRGNEGTWLEHYVETPEQEGDCKCKLSSMSAMPVYFKKSHEELRLEDYQLNGKTGSSETILPTSAEPYNKIDKSPEELRSEDYQSTGKSGSVFGSSLFGRQTFNSAATSLFPTPPPSTNPYPVGNSTSIFQQTSNVDPTFQQTINSFSTLNPSKFSSSAVSSQFVGHPTGGGQFSSVNSIPLFGRIISSPTITSPFGSRPFSSQISSSGPFYTSSVISSQSPLGTSPFGSQISSTSPFFTSSVSQSPLGTDPFGSPISSNSPFFASSVISPSQSPMGTSPFGPQISSTSSPFTSSVISSSQSPVTSFGTTSTINSGFGTSKTSSTGGCPTGTISASSSAVINISISVSPSPISSTSSSTTETPGLCFVNPPASNSQCLGFSVPNTCTSYMPTPFLSVSHPVLVIPLPVSTGHLGNLSFTTQTTISSPASGTVPAFSNSPTTESIITSNPEPVSTGGFIPRFGSSTENKQQPISQWSVSFDPSYVTNPIATEAAATLPKTVQYENSCLPVSDNAERFPLFSARPLSIDRDTLPFEMYKPKEDKKEDNTFIEELRGVYKRRAVPIPQENPPSSVVCPIEEQKLDESLSNLSVSDNSTNLCKKGGKKSWKDIKHGDDHSEKESMPAIIFKGEDHEDSYITTHYTDVIAMIPKLTCPDYYMEPSLDDLAANEMNMPGFCCHVKDFVIGRRGYGSIKFLGETDVRNLDLESIVKFDMHVVKVCMDDKAKLPFWQGVYKAAEITILNVKCIDKNTEKQYIDGPKVDAYKQLLMRKTVEQGGEFVSFDPAKGEWRFKVEF